MAELEPGQAEPSERKSGGLRSQSYSVTSTRSSSRRERSGGSSFSGGGGGSFASSVAGGASFTAATDASLVGECRDESIEFRERHLLPAPLDWIGACLYGVLLLLFAYHTLAPRDQAYYFTQYAREIADLEHFMRIDGADNYRDWLESSFLPGMYKNSVGRAKGGFAGITLVGPPRIRTIRAVRGWVQGDVAGNGVGMCGQAAETAGLKVACFELSNQAPDDGGSDKWFQSVAPWMDTTNTKQLLPQDSGVRSNASATSTASSTDSGKGTAGISLKYMTGAEIGDQELYTSYTGVQYHAGGHVVHGLKQLFTKKPTVKTEPTELFPWGRLRTDAQALLDAGLLHPTTRVVFHDFAIYSATKDAYVSVRLVAEIGLEHGMFIPSKHIRIVWLKDFPEAAVTFEILFYLLLMVLLGECLWTWLGHVKNAEQKLEDATVIARYELQFEILRQAAFKEIFAYRPRILLNLVSERVTIQNPDRHEHIAELNRLGRQVQNLHESYQRFLKDNTPKATGAVDKAQAVLACLALLERLKETEQHWDILRNSQSSAAKKAWVRVQAGTSSYFKDQWRVLDALNYAVFFMAFFVLLKVYALLDQTHIEVKSINRDTPWDDSQYVDFYRVSYWTNSIQRYSYALNAILTWLKCFKFVTHFPQMDLLTRTLGFAARPLAVFSTVLSIVLFGFGQAFFLAFGLDIHGYRTIYTSFTALLRMGVGDFDYNALEQSHGMMGPLLFWFYIFLIFFIMISVFIALISEAYQRAKNAVESHEKKSREAAPLTDPRDPSNSVAEARIRLQNIAEGQVSPKFVDMMKASLPRKSHMSLKGEGKSSSFHSGTSATGQAAVTEKPGLLAELRERRNNKRWRSGLLSEPWERDASAPMLDHVPDAQLAWMDTMSKSGQASSSYRRGRGQQGSGSKEGRESSRSRIRGLGGEIRSKSMAKLPEASADDEAPSPKAAAATDGGEKEGQQLPV